MLLRFRSDYRGVGRSGETRNVDPGLADILIQRGIAERVSKQEARKLEKAIRDTTRMERR